MAERSNAAGCKPAVERLRRFESYSSQSILLTVRNYGAVAQLARAPALHAGGQGFDSPRLQNTSVSSLYVVVWSTISIPNIVIGTIEA